MTQRTFVFRTDGSVDIGTGHVMRCLTLAHALRDAGARCIFVCKDHPGNLLKTIHDSGFVAHRLELSQPVGKTQNRDSSAPGHCNWLGGSWQDDAAQTLKSIGREAIDWVVADHYALGHEWQSRLRGACAAVMALDDLADRRHDCDLILDQNLGRNASDYYGLVPENSRVLVGPTYALLRPEFPAFRSISLSQRSSRNVRQILVSMGGVDKDNATGKVLGALEKATLPAGCKVIVVLGAGAPWLSAVQRQANLACIQIEVRDAITNMAELMSESDFAIGAAGSTSWERCCLGLPSMIVVLARNQREIAENLKKNGVAEILDITYSDEEMSEFVSEFISDPELLKNMSWKGARLVDGKGTYKVARHLLGSGE